MGDTDHLTPEAVKDMMHHHEKGRADNDTGFTRLELNSLALARDWLRLKKVEEAGKALVGYAEGMIEDGWPKCGGDCSGANPPVSFCPIRTIMSDIAAFRAAVEGK